MSNAKTPVAAGKTADQDVSAFLEKVAAMQPAATAQGRGRLVFAMDATMSRQPTWDRALSIQGKMFEEARRIGGLDVQLVYFRGFGECRASRWVADAGELAKLMTTVDCRGGNTQISKVLTHLHKEVARGKVSAVVYVGDAMEENADELCRKAGELALTGTPVFMFQEGSDAATAAVFKEIARLTRGAYFQLDDNSARHLAELLGAVAVYASGGRKALADKARAEGGKARLLLEQLG
ncbi:MAG TPA: VWA domain-containing protein [Aestuariivirga sp.]|nr:VWA domain-containing protein [Aestuariivirga sp.]